MSGLRRNQSNKALIAFTAVSGKIFISVILLLFFNLSFAQQRLDMEGTAIIGNKELPKILYIVPWKSAQPVSLGTPPFSSVLDEDFQPVERSTFKRQLNYYNELYAKPETKH